MALFSAGFNACGQLVFGTEESGPEPDDLYSFTKILSGSKIERPVSRLSYTLVRHDGRLSMAGIGPDNEDEQEAAYLYAEAANDEILTTRREDSHVTKETATVSQTPLLHYASVTSWKAGLVKQSWTPHSPVRTMAAFDTGFIILHEEGTVSTLGDARFEDCLGRDVTEDSPANLPGIVTDLSGLGEPMKHISASGYTLAALTESGAMYVWGLPSRGLQRRSGAFPDLGRVPNYVEIDDGKDVLDMAVGDSHALALTIDGHIYVIGGNDNGQLGLGESDADGRQSWTRSAFQPPSGQRVIAVAAGPRSSFILTASEAVTAETEQGQRAKDEG
ncbi:regulator of chromosome condensation (RCC1)-like protein [Ophiocordyceps camponoti-floridani]|uniref:Regulator of chromosome condensation (RCC1)-like protein n=1 Tax=Ophiocordyceps camponoti-floridani TaxID=2030778 RepID=A0A8H4Q542_9HYPO|nr:regulator of chromosome condensation (RCC1)-like protein [Ophiocordyceps camponoti-floridani]